MAAFTGWQHYLTQPLEKGRRHMRFDQYRRSLGLDGTRAGAADLTDEQRAELTAQAEQNEARVIELFRNRRPT